MKWVIAQNKLSAYDLSDCNTIYVVDCFEISAYMGNPCDKEIDDANLICLGMYDPCGRAMEVFTQLISYLNSASNNVFKMPER